MNMMIHPRQMQLSSLKLGIILLADWELWLACHAVQWTGMVTGKSLSSSVTGVA